MGLVDAWQGEPERPLERLPGRLERTLRLGAGIAVPYLLIAIAFAELAAGRPEQARDRLEGLVALVEGRDAAMTTWALSLLAEARRLLADGDAEATALEAQASGEGSAIASLRPGPRLTLGRLAAARGEWTDAQQHVLAHLDACVEGGHATYVPACLDALAEVAAGLGADEDAVRLFAAAERARAEIGMVRVPPEDGALGGDRRQPARGARRRGVRGGAPPGRRADHRGRARMGAPGAGPAQAPARRLGIAHPHRVPGRRARRRRAHQPPDRRADAGRFTGKPGGTAAVLGVASLTNTPTGLITKGRSTLYRKNGTTKYKSTDVVEFQPDGSITLTGTFEVTGGSGKYKGATGAERSTARFRPGAA